MYAFLIAPLRAALPAHLIIFDLITVIIFGKRYKILSLYVIIFILLSRYPI
jgi:hypothetical protein